MKRLILLAILSALLAAQQPEDATQRRMPDGRTQAEHILEHEYRKSRQDAAELVKLAEALKKELDENDYHVLSLNALRKAERIEKLARRIKNRLKRF